MIKAIRVHQKEQWDLDCYPWLCVHVDTADTNTRVFCLWSGGIQIGGWLWKRIKCETSTIYSFWKDET